MVGGFQIHSQRLARIPRRYILQESEEGDVTVRLMQITGVGTEFLNYTLSRTRDVS